MNRSIRRLSLVILAPLLCIGAVALPARPPTVDAISYQRISGEGSSWAANAIEAMRVNVRQFGMTVDYNPSGSTAGRKNFLNGTVDFAASDIPFQFEPEDTPFGAHRAGRLADGGSPQRTAALSGADIFTTCG